MVRNERLGGFLGERGGIRYRVPAPAGSGTVGTDGVRGPPTVMQDWPWALMLVILLPVLAAVGLTVLVML